MILSAVKALIWEVLFIAFQLHCDWLFFSIFRYSNNLFEFQIPNEMVVHLIVGIEKVDENLCVRDEAAGDKWIREFVIGDGIVVDVKQLVDFDLRAFNFIGIPCFSAEAPESEFAIIDVAASEAISF